jgi:large subunit ribosomal protein L9
MAKKVLLLQDVDSLGRKGEVAQAKEGYVYNFLLPQGLAILATPDALRKQVKLQEERKKVAEQDRKDSEELATRLNGETLAFTVKVDQEGHMYGSVSALDIVSLIKMQTGIDLDKRYVILKHPLKETGTYPITLRLKEGITCGVHVKVIPEHEMQQQA